MKRIKWFSWVAGSLVTTLTAVFLLAGCSLLEGPGEQVKNDVPGVEVTVLSGELDLEELSELGEPELLVHAPQEGRLGDELGAALSSLEGPSPVVMKGLYAGRASDTRVAREMKSVRGRTGGKSELFRASQIDHSSPSTPYAGAAVVGRTLAFNQPASLSCSSIDPGPGRPVFHTEEYDRIYDNPYREVTQNPLSTFSIDVDTASYANTRRFLNDQQLPPKDAVRIEELINYFTYTYPEPRGKEPVSITTEIAACPWNSQHQLALVGLQARSIETESLPANNLTFLLDVSGSMNSPDKIQLLKSGMKLLVDQMRPEDRVAIVVYAGAAGLVLESTPGSDKEKIMSAIDRLRAGGSTAGGAGIKLAYNVAKANYLLEGNNRVILATDGDFNVGLSSDAELVRMIEERRNQGIFLTVLGFGTGNYKDSKMEKLADKGNGNYAYIDDILEAKKALVTEMGSTLVAVAKDVKLQIEFNPSAVKAYRLIGYENRILAKEDFNDDKKDAGEMGASHSVTALYEIIPAGSEEAVPGVDPLKYQQTKVVAESDELMTVKLRYKDPLADTSQLMSHVVKQDGLTGDLSPNFLFASAVAEFGMLLRDSDHKGQASFEAVLKRAAQAKGNDEHGYRAEFVRLVDKAKLLSI